jgi:hypothetical protein
MKLFQKGILAAAALSLSFATSLANAEKGGKTETRESKIEMHQKMSELHSKAVECLKSGKSEEDCHKQMMADCPMAKSGNCPFMAHHKHGKNKKADGHSCGDDKDCDCKHGEGHSHDKEKKG